MNDNNRDSVTNNIISCDICMDLIPLVKDGIASKDSEQAVLRHIEDCDSCRSLYDGELPPAAKVEKALGKLQKQLRLSSAMILMFGIFFGLSLTNGIEVFYNTLLMPIIGALGYYIFRWKALYITPVLLFITHGFINLINRSERLDWYSLLLFTALYAIFALLGVVIAGLIHYALRKDGK